jgi:undecaprenyl-diphosphatase
MAYIHSFFLGLIQGLTEFLPISSSAHLILYRNFFKLDYQVFNLTFDVIVHLGSLLAVLIFFKKRIVVLAKAFFNAVSKRNNYNYEEKLALYIVINSIIVGLMAYLIKDFFEQGLRTVYIINHF